MSEFPVLLFDIGNTNIKVAVCHPDAVPGANTHALPTAPWTEERFGDRLLDVVHSSGYLPDDIAAACVSSVVPSADGLVAETVRRFFGVETLFVPEQLPPAFDNIGDIPGNVGADRLAGAYGARVEFPDPENLIVIDFGTATTMDCVRGNSYLGGFTCPGLRVSADALTDRAAKLPPLTLELPGADAHLTFDTMSSLNQGFILGFAGMIEGLSRRLKPLVGGEAFVVATGGLAHRVARSCTAIDAVSGTVVLSGLVAAYLERTE